MRKTVFLLISALIFLLGSCASLPLPGTYSESLLIVPVRFDRDLGTDSGIRRSVSMAYMEIRNVDTGQSEKLSLIPGSDDYFSATLEPGRYQIENELILTISQTPGNNVWQDRKSFDSGPMLIGESVVYICPLVLKVESNGKGGYFYSYYNTSSNDDPVKRESYEKLKSERRFKAWELYQMVGWETEEE